MKRESIGFSRMECQSGENYFARVEEFPGCMTWAKTFEELGPMIEGAKAAWIEDALEDGDHVPEPRELEGYSGKINIRIPRSLHRELSRSAEAEGVSLNQLVVFALTRSLSGGR